MPNSYYDAATTKTLTFTYQAGTGRSTSTVAPGNTWAYYYDSATRPQYTTQTVSGEIARFDYNTDGSVQRRRNPNNTKAEFTYDTRGRVTGIRHAVTSLDQTQEQVGYTYTNGNVSQYTLAIQGGASYVTNYVHDNANRLLSEIRTDSSSANAFSKSYVYTKGNDRVSTTKNGTTSTYTYFAGANRFKSGEGYTVNSYDNDGNPTSITVPGSVTWTLSYDEDSRLTQILKSGGNCYFKYNGDGQRVERITSTSTYRYLLNGDSVLLTTTTGPTYVVQAYYSAGIGYFSGGQMHFYQENALGSALVVRDAAGNWESLTEYDAYGGEYAINGTQKSDFRFAGAHGYLKDDDTGMDLLGARFYIPVLGRFLNQDPIGITGGLNLYAYCENGPLSRLDSDGKRSQDLFSKYLDGWNRWWDSLGWGHQQQSHGNNQVWGHFSDWWNGKGPNSVWHKDDSMHFSFQRSQTYASALNYIRATNYKGQGKNGGYENGAFSTLSHLSAMFIGGDYFNDSAWSMGAMNWRAVRHGEKMNIIFWTTWSQNSLYGHLPFVKNVPRVSGQRNAPQSNVSHYFLYSIDIPKGK